MNQNTPSLSQRCKPSSNTTKYYVLYQGWSVTSLRTSGPGVQLVTSEEGDVVAVHMSQANGQPLLLGVCSVFLSPIVLAVFRVSQFEKIER